MKRCPPLGKLKDSLKVSKFVQRCSDSSGQCIDSWSCALPLRQDLCVPFAFVVGWSYAKEIPMLQCAIVDI